MPYNQQLSTNTPGYIVILLDQSGSMGDIFNTGSSKADECAKAVNRVLRELGFACTTRENKIRNRIDISILSYGLSGNEVSNAFSGSLAQKPFVTMQELVTNVVRIEKVKRKMSDGAGGLVEIEEDFPIWIESAAVGGTPMAEAFMAADKLVSNWAASHQSSFPPIVFNITDGEPNDAYSAKEAALKLVETTTDDGNTLLLNIHISNSKAGESFLPSSINELPQDRYAHFLFDLSSELPPVLRDRASAAGFEPKANAKGFTYNAKTEHMVALLDIGTKEIQLR